ncbi:MAG TPA: hypothetical protein VMM35_02895 [Longimicrobiales bacterium]|nr:hypothetical protein [Longimicrobiales bacterium]
MRLTRVRRLSSGHLCLALAVASFSAPVPVTAQLGAIEAFARRVTDLSFNAHLGGLAPKSDEVRADAAGLRSFGLELLFEIGTVERPTGPAPPVADTATLTWTQMIVEVGPDGVDTTYLYEVRRPTRPGPPMRPIWTFEMGIGYNQLFGFDAGDPSFDMRGQVRDLPAATLYASYEPLGFYFGLRSGFMQVQGLQVYNEAGEVFAGKADAFLLGGLVGRSTEILGINLFVEGAYSIRSFPSVEWRSLQSGIPLDRGLPRDLSFTSWSIGTGIQFGMGS